jgi:hypothetical protein
MTRPRTLESVSACTHAKFAEIVLADLRQIEDLGTTLDGYDVCLESLGASERNRS